MFHETERQNVNIEHGENFTIIVALTETLTKLEMIKITKKENSEINNQHKAMAMQENMTKFRKDLHSKIIVFKEFTTYMDVILCFQNAFM